MGQTLSSASWSLPVQPDFFENTVDTIFTVAIDTMNYILDTTASSSGNITLVVCGVATGQEARTRTGVGFGLVVRNRVG